MRRLSDRLTSLSIGWAALAATALFIGFMVVVLPAQSASSEEALGDVGSPDLSLIYSADDLYGWAEAYGPEGRDTYVRLRWTFDLAWPLVYGVFYVLTIGWIGRHSYAPGSRWRLLNLVPLVGVALDYLENVLASVVMLRYPAETTIAAVLASPVSLVKWVFVASGFVILAVGGIVWGWNRIRR